jgi:hypothetical protein
MSSTTSVPIPVSDTDSARDEHVTTGTSLPEYSNHHASLDWSVLSEIGAGVHDQRTYNLGRMIKVSLLTGNSDPQGSKASNPFEKSVQTTKSPKNTDLSILDSERESCEVYLDHYFECVHPTFPFLRENHVRQAFKQASHKSQRHPSKIIVYIVLAIGTCAPTISNFHDIYVGSKLFLLVLTSLDTCGETFETAQILVLLTVYSLLHSSAGSSWHLIGLTMRMCITLGLHQESSLLGFSGDELDQRRTLF